MMMTMMMMMMRRHVMRGAGHSEINCIRPRARYKLYQQRGLAALIGGEREGDASSEGEGAGML